MKKFILPLVLLSVTGSAVAQPLDRSIRPKAGPAPTISLGKSESFTLANGLKVFVVENHKLPAVTYSLQLDIKPGLEGNAAGYHQAVGELISSGTKTRTKDQLNAETDAIGADIGADHESMYGNSLKKHQTKLLELMSDMLLNSSFKQAELDKIKTQTLSGLETEKNSPDAMLRNVSAVVNFGKSHPYGEVPTDQTVKNITLQKCNDYYRTYFRPNVAYLAVVGDVTLAEVKPLVEKYFGAWQKGTVPVATYPAPPDAGTTMVAMVPRDAAVQSVFNVTYPVHLEPGSADVVKARVANTILGGGSVGRLFQNLRETHGWTYGSYSSIQEDDVVGSFTAFTKCRNAVTDSAVAETLAEMRRMSSDPIDATTLASTQMLMTGSFAMGLEDPQKVAQYAINIERYKMPKDYYQNYLKNLNAVTVADVQDISRRYINPTHANIVVVGSQEEVAKKLEQFGKVTYYDNNGNPMAAPVAAAAAPAGMTGDQVYQKYITAIGGAAAIGGIKDIRIVRTASMQGAQITFTQLKMAGGKFKQVVSAQGMVFQKLVLNGDNGYQEAQGQKVALAGDDLKDAQEEADLQADLHPEKYGNKRTLRGQDKLNGTDVYVVDATDAAGKKTTEYFDAATGFLVKSISSATTPQGEVSQATEYSDYREVPGTGGYKIAYMVKQDVAGQQFEAALSTVEINKGIADTEFQ